MVALNALQKELVAKGLAPMPKQRKKNLKQFKCHRCKQPMNRVPDSNIMYCPSCGNYFLFNEVM